MSSKFGLDLQCKVSISAEHQRLRHSCLRNGTSNIGVEIQLNFFYQRKQSSSNVCSIHVLVIYHLISVSNKDINVYGTMHCSWPFHEY